MHLDNGWSAYAFNDGDATAQELESTLRHSKAMNHIRVLRSCHPPINLAHCSTPFTCDPFPPRPPGQSKVSLVDNQR